MASGEKGVILVVGVGNVCRSDDGVGIVVARKLKAMGIPSVLVREESGEGASLIEAWKGVGKAIIVDATSAGSLPGTLRRLDVGQQTIPASFFHYSSHAFGVAEAIELARVLGRLPPQCVVFGIEGEEFAAGMQLSLAVDRSVDQAVQAILQECVEHELA